MNTLTTPQHCFRQAVLSFWVPSVLLEPRFQRWVSDGGCVVRDGRSRKDGQDLQDLFLLEAGIQEGLQLCGTDVSSLLDELPCEPRKSRVFRGTRQETLPGFRQTCSSHKPSFPQLFTADIQRPAASCLARSRLSSCPLISSSSVVPFVILTKKSGK
jgi:hypothetical protein